MLLSFVVVNSAACEEEEDQVSVARTRNETNARVTRWTKRDASEFSWGSSFVQLLGPTGREKIRNWLRVGYILPFGVKQEIPDDF